MENPIWEIVWMLNYGSFLITYWFGFRNYLK